jgi:hypothetical protein
LTAAEFGKIKMALLMQATFPDFGSNNFSREPYIK